MSLHEAETVMMHLKATLEILSAIGKQNTSLQEDVSTVIAALTSTEALKATAYRLSVYRKSVERHARSLLSPQLVSEKQRMLEILIEVCSSLEEPLDLLIHYDQVQQDRLLIQQCRRAWELYRLSVQPWLRLLGKMGVAKLEDFDKEFRSLLQDLG